MPIILWRTRSTNECNRISHHEIVFNVSRKSFYKATIYEAGWNETSYIDDNSIMVCISKLRSKLDDGEKEHIKTIRGLGYRLEKS